MKIKYFGKKRNKITSQHYIQQFSDSDDRNALINIVNSRNCDSINENIRISKTQRDIQKSKCFDEVSNINDPEHKQWYYENGNECKEARQKAELVELMRAECNKKKICACDYDRK
jgi:lipopolysaccharide export LptBFGC system permease protein LptF